MFYKDISLGELVNLADWQKIQDSFSELLEVTLRTISLDGNLLSRISCPSRYCSEIMSKCKDLDLAAAIKNGGNIKMPFGVDFFLVPIKAIGNREVAYLMLGPIIVKSRKAVSEYKEEAKNIGIDPDVLADILIEINVFSHSKVYSMMGLIKDIFSHMAQTGYHKKRLGEIAPKVVEMDPLFSKYYEDKILSAMLKTCSMALNADSGSVMVMDTDTKTLHIKVASKLDNNIVNNTSLKVGEGIAGIAAATAKPIILPQDKDKNGLSEKMKRNSIKSSMIVPFNKGDNHEVYGVINLNIARKGAAFTEKDIALVKELVNLTSVALTPLRMKSS
jgi:ligand-binding sensor protein